MKFLTISFVKNYNKEKKLNTSDTIFDVMNDYVKTILDKAQINSVKEGRKTVMKVDIEKAINEVKNDIR